MDAGRSSRRKTAGFFPFRVLYLHTRTRQNMDVKKRHLSGAITVCEALERLIQE